MHDELLLSLGREALLLLMMVSVPPLAASLITGFVASFLQAATQIQEQTLSAVPRLCASALALVLSWPWISSQLMRFCGELFKALPEVS